MHAEEQIQAVPTDRVISGLPVEPKVLFSDKRGIYKPRIEKGRTKLLRNLGFLSRFLDADEKILLVTTGCSPFTAIEQLTIGAAWVVAVKRALFVFTTRRLFHIPVTSGLRYRGSTAQILYEDCRRLYVKGSALVVEYHTGGKDKFLYIPGGDRAIIRNLRLQASESDRPSDNPRRNHLCPNCVQILPSGAVACPSCGLEFKNKAAARRYSVLIPGGGYFYTNHVFMGIADALVETYLTVITLVAFVATLLGDPEALVPAILFAAAMALEKLITIHHSNSFLTEFIPKDLKSVLSGQTPATKPVEPLPPLEEVPQGTRRPEDILSVR